MASKFPFTNYHELNLTWVLEQLKKLFEESTDNVETIQTYNGRLTAVEAELPVVAENAAAASQEAAAAASIAQTASNKADTAQENALQASAQAGQARQEATAATAAAAGASQAADQAQATALNFDGRITQAEDDAAAALSASRSFEERVNAATNTANNAAQTATTAQGIATNANQNAAAALDKIGNLSDLDTTNKNNLVAAINEALENGGAVDSVNGKTGVVVLDASDIGYDSGTVAGELGTLKTALSDLSADKQDAPATAGTAGQVLGLDSQLNPVWINQSGGGDNTNCAPLIINSAYGAVASFSDGADNLQIRKIVGTIKPVQSGTGDPSPENIRPISGWAGATINHSNADTTNPQTITINWESEAGTIYGGTVTLNEDGSVDILVTKAGKTISQLSGGPYISSGLLRWNYINDLFPGFIHSGNYNAPNAIATMLRGVGDTPIAATDAYRGTFAFGRSIFWLSDNTCATAEAYREKYADCLIVWDLDSAHQQTIHIPSVGQLYTFFGVNNVWIDTGSISECEYPADTKLYIDGKIAELQALVLENNG